MTITSVRAIRDTESSKPLVERLIATGLISDDQLQRALRAKRTDNEPLGKVLVRLGMISESVLGDTLQDLIGDPVIDLRAAVPDQDALALVSKDIAFHHCIVPIGFDENAQLLTLAVSEDSDVTAIAEIAELLDSGIGVETRVASEVDIEFAISKFYKYDLSIPGILREIDSNEAEILNASCADGGYSHTLNRLVDAILADAVNRNASRVHFEPEYGFLRVRYRTDGVLRQTMALHKNYWPGIAARLIWMSGINADVDPSVREGRFTMSFGTRRYGFRILCQETTHGKRLIVRIFELDREIVPLEQLGLANRALATLRLMAARPAGLIIVAGPHDSGKTTTLYSMLCYRNDETVSVVTIDDPLRYQVSLIQQTLFRACTEPDYAQLTRSMMHQDADLMLVGELDDKETAEAVFAAAANGYQMFTTVQANCAVSALTRLLDLGINPRAMAANIIGIVSQRLVRRLCRSCRRPYAPTKAECQLLGISAPKPKRLYRPGACEECNFVGYKGRIGIFEVLKIDSEIDEMIALGATCRDIDKAARKAGFRNLVDDAIRHVLAGETSLSEASRIVDLTDRF